MWGLNQFFDANCSLCALQCFLIKAFFVSPGYVVLWHPPVIGDFFSVGFKMFMAWTNRKFAHLSKSPIGHKRGGVVCSVYVLLHYLNFYGTTFSLPSRRCWRVFFMDHNWIIAGGLHAGKGQPFFGLITELKLIEKYTA